MAIYTTYNQQDFEQILSLYNKGEYLSHKGIAEGSRNTTYLLETTTGQFILTVFERQSEIKTLENILSTLHILNSDLPEAVPALFNQEQKLFTIYKDKHLALFPYIMSQPYIINEISAHEAGVKLADLHNLNIQNSKLINAYPVTRLKEIAHNLQNQDKSAQTVLNNIKEPSENLPKGLCHLDYFADNLLYNDSKVVAIIDWFMMAEETYLYDFCIGLCAWGFNNQGQLEKEQFDAFYKAYTKNRPLNFDEETSYKSEFKRAACRFLTTRLQDKHFPQSENAPILPPEKFINILKYIGSE